MKEIQSTNPDSQNHLDNLDDSKTGLFISIGIFIGLILLTGFSMFIKFKNPDVLSLQFTATKTTDKYLSSPTQVIASPTPTATQVIASPTPTVTTVEGVFTTTSTPTLPIFANIFSQENYEAKISCEEISKVSLRESPGYVNKNDTKDVIIKIPCEESLNLQYETKYEDKLTWWKVNWKGYKGWVSDHTGNGKVILVFTQPIFFSQSNPEEFIFWYFNAIWQQRNYKDLWNNFLTIGFQNHSSTGNFDDYVHWWDTVSHIDINKIEILRLKETNAWVRINVNFYLTDERVLNNRKYDYNLVFDTTKSIWMFDYP